MTCAWRRTPFLEEPFLEIMAVVSRVRSDGWRYYLGALLAACAWAVLNQYSYLWIGGSSPLLTGLLLVALSSAFAGFGATLLATAVSTAYSAYWFFAPFASFSVDVPADRQRLAIYVAECILIALAGRRSRQSEGRRVATLAQANRQLCDSNNELRALRDELQTERDRWELALRGNNDGLWDWNPQTDVPFFSPRWKEMLGYADHEIPNRQDEWESRVHPDDLPWVRRAIHDHLQRKTDFFVAEYRLRCKDGSYKWILDRGQALWNERGEPVRMVGSHTDMTERRRAEAELTEANALLRNEQNLLAAVLHQMPDGVIIAEAPSGQVLMGNEIAERIWGSAFPNVTSVGRYDSWVAYHLEGFPYGPDEWPMARSLLRAETVTDERIEVRREPPDTRTYSVNSAPVHDDRGRTVAVVGTLQDVTDRLRLEAQLRQSQKMEAVGQLAGGLAHDFNNLLTVILGYGNLLASDLPAGSTAHRRLQEVQAAGERAAALTRRLLAFSRKQLTQARLVNANEVIRGFEMLLVSLLGPSIELRLELASDVGQVVIDPGHLEQVVMNLAVNARDAMPSGGRLTIRTANVRVTDRDARCPTAKPGDYAELTIADTGQGMEEATRAHVFEPFFTTKPVGQGTGLGLAIVHTLVTQAGGWVNVQTAPGQGATFRMCLPLATDLPAPVPSAVPERTASSAETQSVLLVDDEPLLRGMAAEILRSAGYTVWEAGNGSEALRTASSLPAPVDVIVTDVIMPGLSGPELARELRRSWSGVPVLYVSGYTDDALQRRGVLDAGDAFLPKPFTPEALVRRLAELVHGRNPREG